MLRPKSLKKGHRIGVVSPSYWLEKKGLRNAVTVFQKKGYEVQLGDSVYFGSMGIRKTRHALVAGLFADAVGVFSAVYICRFFFG